MPNKSRAQKGKKEEALGISENTAEGTLAN